MIGASTTNDGSVNVRIQLSHVRDVLGRTVRALLAILGVVGVAIGAQILLLKVRELAVQSSNRCMQGQVSWPGENKMVSGHRQMSS